MRKAMTFASWTDEWLARRKKDATTEKSYRYYESVIGNKAMPFFGPETALDSIEPDDVERWIEHMRNAGLSITTIAKAVDVLKRVFRDAVYYRHLTVSPVHGVAPVRRYSAGSNRKYVYVQKGTN